MIGLKLFLTSYTCSGVTFDPQTIKKLAVGIDNMQIGQFTTTKRLPLLYGKRMFSSKHSEDNDNDDDVVVDSDGHDDDDYDDDEVKMIVPKNDLMPRKLKIKVTDVEII